MSEVFSIQLSNHTTQPDGKTGVWLDLPATAEQVQAAMGQIGVTQDNPWDYFISGFSSPEGRHLAIPYDLALASGVNELNFLAARLEKLDTYEIGTLNAALQQKTPNCGRSAASSTTPTIWITMSISLTSIPWRHWGTTT